MEIEVCAVSGYSEVGKNMTAVRVDNEVVIIDMGVSIPAISNFEREKEGNFARDLPSEDLIRIGAIPDDRKIDDWKLKDSMLGSSITQTSWITIPKLRFSLT